MPKKNVALAFDHGNESKVPILELPWQNSFALAGKQSRLREKILELAHLPGEREWLKIIKVSEREKLPSIRRRSQPSELEHLAANLITYLALAKTQNWPRVVNALLKNFCWALPMAGRPKTSLKLRLDVIRGQRVDACMKKFRRGFILKTKLRVGDGPVSNSSQEIEGKLRKMGYVVREIRCILAGRTLQDAACRYLAKPEDDVHVEMKTLRNSYARYKRQRASH